LLVLGAALASAVLATAGWVWWPWSADSADLQNAMATEPIVRQVALATELQPSETIPFPRESWQAAEIELQPVRRASWSQSVELTGKIALDDDRVAHIYPLVDGRVQEVRVRFGQHVKKGDLLVVVESKEVGQAMLQLATDRLQRDFAVTKDRWTQEVAANTQIMIDLIRQGAMVDEIEHQLRSRPMGEYRDKLMTAYIAVYKSRLQLDRVQPLSKSGAVSGRLLLDAETERDTTRATLQSLLEQVQQDVRQAAILSAQAVKECQTRVSVDETNLKILGFSDEAISSVDPEHQGQSISHYPIYAPFDGTIISKDVVLLERIGPESQILSIADLSTVWLSTDIYEEHLPLLARLHDHTIRFRSPAWRDRTFEAQVFYTGDLVHESTRTLSMRATADNQHGLLKPGMFVNVELPLGDESQVLQVPEAAIASHEGKSFVFVHVNGDQFQRRDIETGRRSAGSVEIVSGLKGDETVVVRGGFALKSRMLAELLEE
jgi:cobalt-zinc-cadmium efflux system membrane fusion protein